MPNLEVIFMNVCLPVLAILLLLAYIAGFHIFMHLQALLMIQEMQEDLPKIDVLPEGDLLLLTIDTGTDPF